MAGAAKLADAAERGWPRLTPPSPAPRTSLRQQGEGECHRALDLDREPARDGDAERVRGSRFWRNETMSSGMSVLVPHVPRPTRRSWVTTTVGLYDGKIKEQALVINVWY